MPEKHSSGFNKRNEYNALLSGTFSFVILVVLLLWRCLSEGSKFK